MTADTTPQQSHAQAIAQALQEAVAQHQAGQLQMAEKLYQAILQIEPNHPEANHNMGVLSVQKQQPAAGLSHFICALEADPTRGQYWLSYIDALFQSGQLDEARQVLAIAQQQGLQGDEIEALALLLGSGTQKTDLQASFSTASAISQNSEDVSKDIPGKAAKHKGKEPAHQDRNEIVALFNAGRYTEVAALARNMTEHFPQSGFGWNVLGVVLKQTGQIADALIPLQKAAALSPDDSNAHCNLGATLQDMGRPEEAEMSLRRALQINPGNADAHCNLGMTLHSLGRLTEAEAAFRDALAIKPDFAEAHCNLGMTLHGLGRLAEAGTSYRRALQHKPDFAEAHCNLGITLQSLGSPVEAEASFRRALEIKPDHAEAHCNLGITLQSLGRPVEAEASFRRALHIKPNHAEAHSSLAITLQQQGRLDEALQHFQQRSRLTPGNTVTQHQIASLTGKNTDRAPEQYVEIVFDNYAEKFDTHLQQVLQYDVPKKLVTLISRHLPSTAKCNVLDLGCGTGLMGAEIFPFARQLVGVDLSAKMLEKARARKLYQRLERLDLLTMMRGEQTASYDLIIAADVFVYLGRLDEIMGEILRLLVAGGVFAFSVETLDAPSDTGDIQGVEQDYQLRSTGRYAHANAYLARLAASNGFQIQEMVATQIRVEGGNPVHGHMAVWKK